MNVYKKTVEVRWSDLDPNNHLRHSVYYDWGDHLRLTFFLEHGLSPSESYKYHVGPILFREECIFKREIKFGDTIELNLRLVKCRRDISRWSITHEVWRGDTLCAIVNVDGAWIDTTLRKIAVPPVFVQDIFAGMPKTENFEWIEV